MDEVFLVDTEVKKGNCLRRRENLLREVLETFLHGLEQVSKSFWPFCKVVNVCANA